MSNTKKSKIPLQQSRLASLNHNPKIVHRPHQSPLTEKRKQISLNAFCFKNKSSGDTKENTLPNSLEGLASSPVSNNEEVVKPKKRAKRKRKYLADDYEVAETQFAQREPYIGSENEEPPQSLATPLTPVSAPPESPLKSTRTPMLPPPLPTTPRRRRLVEIPSSHSPPVTPLSPYVSQKAIINSPPVSPSLSRKKRLKSAEADRERETVKSSQWWENEDTQSATLATQAIFLADNELPDEEEEEEQEERIGGSLPVQRALFKQKSSTSSRDLDWDILTVKSSPRDDDNAPVPSEEEPELPNSLEDSQVIPGHVDFSNLSQERPVVPKVRSLSPEEAPWKSNQEDQLRSENSIHPFSEKDDIPPSSPPAYQNGEVSAEAQYSGADASYGWWDINPAPEVEEIEVKEVKKEDLGKDHKGDNQEDSDSEEMVTMSQLLPETLMETFPMPPPMTQFSSIPNWNISDT